MAAKSSVIDYILNYLFIVPLERSKSECSNFDSKLQSCIKLFFRPFVIKRLWTVVYTKTSGQFYQYFTCEF